jgi:hypothetical protein
MTAAAGSGRPRFAVASRSGFTVRALGVPRLAFAAWLVAAAARTFP